jgi:hypothetical protein
VVSNHPGEVLERIVLAPVFGGQLGEAQGRIVGEVAARVVVDESLEGVYATGAIRAEHGEGLGVCLLILRAGALRGGPQTSSAAEEECCRERDEPAPTHEAPDTRWGSWSTLQ